MKSCIVRIFVVLCTNYATVYALDGFIDRGAVAGTRVRTQQYFDAAPLRFRLPLGLLHVPLIATSNSTYAEKLVGSHITLIL